MTEFPINNFYNINKYQNLERLNSTPTYPSKEIKERAKKFYLRRDRLHKEVSNIDKYQAATGSLIGTTIPLLLMMKKQGVKNPFKVKYGLKDMLILSGAPIIGGVSVGMIGNDAETNLGKSWEGVFQFLNAAIPTWLAGAALRLCETTPAINNIPAKIASILGAVLTGMYGAAELSNKICDPKDKHPDRNLTLKDALANMDDLVGVFVLAKFPMADKLHIEKLLPLIYSYCGYRAGKSN